MHAKLHERRYERGLYANGRETDTAEDPPGLFATENIRCSIIIRY